MIKSEELDRAGFKEIMQNAVAKISKIYSAWNDYNLSDPGMTMLELMTWYSEVAQFHLNVIDDVFYKKYLKLLGRKTKSVTPSRTYLALTGDNHVPANSRFYAKDIPFETEYELDCISNQILSVQCGNQWMENKNGLFSGIHSKMLLHPFGSGEDLEPFEIHLKNPIPKGAIFSFYVDVEEQEGMNQINDSFVEYVKIHVEREGTNHTWNRDLEILKDETRGFVKSGVIVIQATEGIQSVYECATLRFVIEDGEYVKKPAISGLIWNVVSAKQVMTVQQAYPLGVSTGICNSRFLFDTEACIPESIALYVTDKEESKWTLVDDFSASDASSKHFIYDEKTKEIIFGDGEHGKVPRGEIIIKTYQLTKGFGGNIKEYQLEDYNEELGISAMNILPAVGGEFAQSIAECFEECIRENQSLARCVTLQDFEDVVKQTPGVPVHRVKAFIKPDQENRVFIAVELHGDKKTLNNGAVANIRKNIEPKKMIGTEVQLCNPQYSQIQVYVEVFANAYQKDIDQITKQAIYEYFDSEQINFGDTIKKNDLNRYLYSLPWISGVRSLEITASGNTANTKNNGDVKLKIGFLPNISNITVLVSDRS